MSEGDACYMATMGTEQSFTWRFQHPPPRAKRKLNGLPTRIALAENLTDLFSAIADRGDFLEMWSN